jgi:hypothetical protein
LSTRYMAVKTRLELHSQYKIFYSHLQMLCFSC